MGITCVGDGKLDLAVANSGGNTVSILMGNGDGTFQTQTTYTSREILCCMSAPPTSTETAILT
ncbi:MAG TPA: VCBS repeat-containing protein, partial [Terriglobales bacterium]|nr:VCBS repeat-containing protein [Terriglobales bacterium]